MPMIYTSNSVDLISLFIIGVLVLGHPKSDGLVAAFEVSNPALNPAALAVRRRIIPVTALTYETHIYGL
jgi:hypothetical protein